jgi:hypothetical protein
MTDDHDTTRRRLLLGAGAGATVLLAGCSGNGGGDTPTTTDEPMDTPTATDEPMDTPTESGRLRAVHASPNAPNVDIYADGTAVLEDVPFGAISQYLEVPAGERQLRITPAGDSETTVFEGAVPVAADTDYTVVASGEIGDMADESFQPLVLEDDNADPGEDMARVRAVHASPDAPAVDITVAASGDTLFDGVPYGESGAVAVPAGEYTLEIRGDTESNDGDVVASYDVSLAGGQVYSAFAVGYLSPDDEPADTPFDLLLAQDTGGMSGSMSDMS